MEWSDVSELYRYWAESPPTHELVAAYLGVKPQGQVPSSIRKPEASLSEMRQALEAGRKVGRG